MRKFLGGHISTTVYTPQEIGNFMAFPILYIDTSPRAIELP